MTESFSLLSIMREEASDATAHADSLDRKAMWASWVALAAFIGAGVLVATQSRAAEVMVAISGALYIACVYLSAKLQNPIERAALDVERVVDADLSEEFLCKVYKNMTLRRREILASKSGTLTKILLTSMTSVTISVAAAVVTVL